MKKSHLLMVVLFAVILASCANQSGSQPVMKDGLDGNASGGQPAFQIIRAEELDRLMREDDLILINVHIPLEGNIPGTDQTVPYNDIGQYLHLLPEDKDEKIYLYCLSGGMGDIAAQTLARLGYTQIWNLEGGYNAWRAAGLPFEEVLE